MKVFIHYNSKRRPSFEGDRLRKSLKGACELAGISWVDSPKAMAKLAHFLSPEDEFLLSACKEEGAKTVVSAFYCEFDPHASFLVDGLYGKPALSQRGLRMLNLADLVLVPNENLRRFARESGVTTRIEAQESAVNLLRLNQDLPDFDIFPRYMHLKLGEKFALIVGNYQNSQTVLKAKKLASLCPNVRFYFLGSGAGRLRVHGANRGSPKNITFLGTVEDDVYRSAMMNASAYVLLNHYRPAPIEILEAFASKTNVIVYGSQPFNAPPLTEENSSALPAVEEIAERVDRLCHAEAKETIISGYQAAKRRTLHAYGKELKGFYESLLGQDNN